MRVLLAEDNVRLARATEVILEKNGLDVEVAHDGLEALDALDRLGRYAVQVFDGVYLMDGEHDRIDVLRCVHDRVLPGQVFHGIAPSMLSSVDTVPPRLIYSLWTFILSIPKCHL